MAHLDFDLTGVSSRGAASWQYKETKGGAELAEVKWQGGGCRAPAGQPEGANPEAGAGLSNLHLQAAFPPQAWLALRASTSPGTRRRAMSLGAHHDAFFVDDATRRLRTAILAQ